MAYNRSTNTRGTWFQEQQSMINSASTAELRGLCDKFDENFETIFILSDAEFSHISSTCVRELIKGDKSLLGVVPKEVEKRIIELYKSKK